MDYLNSEKELSLYIGRRGWDRDEIYREEGLPNVG